MLIWLLHPVLELMMDAWWLICCWIDDWSFMIDDDQIIKIVKSSNHPTIQSSHHPIIKPSNYQNRQNHQTIKPSNYQTIKIIQPSNYQTIKPSKSSNHQTNAWINDRGAAMLLINRQRELCNISSTFPTFSTSISIAIVLQYR